MPNLRQKIDPRVRRTRKLIKQAFIDIMMDKGFDAMSVQDIADQAEINRATFYAHYTDKFDLHDHMLKQWFQEKLNHYDVTADKQFCGDTLRSLIFAVCDFQAQLNQGCHPMDMQYKPAIEDLIQSEIYSIVHQWMQSLDGITHSDIVATAISWSIFGAGAQWSRNPQHSKAIVADTVIAMIRDGLKSQVTTLPTLSLSN
ncbi:MAG: TetR/AcrR family transcriptional regulator [Phototrophicaceae bacterium]